MAQAQKQDRRDSQAVAKRPDQTEALSKATGFRAEQINPFVTTFTGEGGVPKPYVNRAGRIYKMNKLFGVGKWKIETAPPAEVQYELFRRMMGIPIDKPFIMMESKVYVRCGGAWEYLANNFTSVVPETCLGGPSQFVKHGIGYTVSKAISRTLGLVTGEGFTDESDAYRPEGEQIHFLRECQRLKAVVGDEAYYGVLADYGVDHSNETVIMCDHEISRDVLADLKIIAADMAGDALFDRPPVHGVAQDTPVVADTAGEVEDQTSPPPGREVLAVADEDATEAQEPPKPIPAPGGRVQYVDETGAQRLLEYAAKFGIVEADLRQHIASEYGVEDIVELMTAQYRDVRLWIQEQK